ncbi:helix-turn-helix domain-containing protein [Nocardia farcinica]|uniref:helix-turn-helix domain-containing protein n=1 Tax=Nocardia farcinica TaxID=37329 RepID=UPI000DFBF66A|nr:helix-turn-helix domain-containing protein [Nocardia farcinica]MBA4857096.1 helix-turn-helix domain-containing protein [Nocardia farcinica]MBC9817173.1 helix-turn-helix domain-containing protein [Nocardia farcinica]MBF6262711.1 helix-turn-helix domain-containing protein [Nocardia farcinica]MBF6281215.1 helix-turn-helix domain-containing protein [Nocardia farcinica]MBF6305989.1 helix-turn-helix domain-containing protein [Nocardia farcinica]
MRSTTAELPELLTAAQTAEYIGVSEDALAQDRYLGRGLPYVRVGRRIRYRAGDIAAYLEANTVRPGT